MTRRTFCLAGAAAFAACAQEGAAAGAAGLTRGLYANGDGRLAAIGAFHEFGEGQFLFDYSGRRAGRVAAGDAGGFRLLSTFTDAGESVAMLNPTADGLALDEVLYRPIPIRREAFAVEQAGVTLHGEIAERSDRTPRGAILLIYGSGPGPKEALDFWAFHFIARGWRVATYDKRGSGRSGGDWRTSLEILAADAAQAVRHLRAVTPSHLPIAAWGASQGGWIAPQLGARALVDLIILHAGAATKPAEQILLQVESELAAYGFPAEEIARARDYYALDLDVSRGLRPWPDVEAAHRIAAAAGAEWLLGPPAPVDAPEREMTRLMADFDPAPFWQANRAPSLAIFGGRDVIVPPEPNRFRLRALVPARVELSVALLAEANHLGFVGDTGVRAEYARQTRIDPGYFAAIDGWSDPYLDRAIA